MNFKSNHPDLLNYHQIFELNGIMFVEFKACKSMILAI